MDDSDDPLEDKDINRLLEIAIEVGVIKKAENNRFMVDSKLHRTLEQIFERFEE